MAQFSNYFIYAMFILDNNTISENTQLKTYTDKTIKKSHPKRIKNKQKNIQYRSQHQIIQPRWRGYSH